MMIRDLAEIYKALLPLYYVTQEAVGRGRALYAKETKFTPECIVCHPNDLDKIKTGGRPLVHLREWKGKFPFWRAV